MSDSHVQLIGRDAIVNAAMAALARGFWGAYERNKITNGEATAWLNNNRNELYMFAPCWRQFLIDGLNEEIEYVTKNGVEATTVKEMNEIIKILSEQAPAAALVSEQTPAAAPAAAPAPAPALVSEPTGKQEAAKQLTALIEKLMKNNIALNAKAKHHLFILLSSDPEKKRKEATELTALMINHAPNPVDRLRAMEYITILKGNEGGYRQRTKHSKKHSKKSRKSRKTNRNRKTKSRRH
jgi:hypothetical protein